MQDIATQFSIDLDINIYTFSPPLFYSIARLIQSGLGESWFRNNVTLLNNPFLNKIPQGRKKQTTQHALSSPKRVLLSFFYLFLQKWALLISRNLKSLNKFLHHKGKMIMETYCCGTEFFWKKNKLYH